MDLYLKFNDPEYAEMVKELLGGLPKGMLYELLNLRKELKYLEPMIGGIIKPTDPLYCEVEKRIINIESDDEEKK